MTPNLSFAALFDDAAQLTRQGLGGDAAALYRHWLAGDAAARSAPAALSAVHFNLGVLLVSLGDAGGAEAAYRAAVLARPSFAQAHLNLGLLLQVLGRNEEALNCWSMMLGSIDAESDKQWYVQGLNRLGSLLAALGRKPQARLMFQRSLQQDGGQTDIAGALAALG